MNELTKQRLSSLRKKMAAAGCDLVALGPGFHMHWLLGYHPHPDERPCLLLIGPETESFLMPALNAEATKAHTDIAMQEWDDADGPNRALAAALAAAGASEAKSVSLDETMRADFALLLLDTLPGAAHGFADKTVGALRIRKDQTEYESLKENALIADKAMRAAFAALKPGIRENEVGQIVRSTFAENGAQPIFGIVASGPNGAMPHHHTGGRELASGDAVVIDIGARKGSFSSDITRMAVIGEAPEGYEAVHAIVEAAQQAALAVAKPGVVASAVDAAARTVISNAGYGEYFVHRTGHGLGIEVHEPPYLTSTSRAVLEEGMVFSIEPGIYLPGRFGIRLEEIVILRADGPEILSELPRTLFTASA